MGYEGVELISPCESPDRQKWQYGHTAVGVAWRGEQGGCNLDNQFVEYFSALLVPFAWFLI